MKSMNKGLNLLVIALITISIGFSIGCIEESVKDEPTATAVPTVTVPQESVESGILESGILEIGESTTINDIAVKVTGIERTDEIELSSGGIQSTDEGDFILVNVEVTNLGEETTKMYPFNFHLLMRDMKVGNVVYLGEDKFGMNQDISPGDSMSGVVLYTIPKTENDLEFRYYSDSTKNAETATWNCQID